MTDLCPRCEALDYVDRVFRAPDGTLFLVSEGATDDDLAELPDGSVELLPTT